IAVVDDRWLTLGSANLNEHSLFNDTEVNVALFDSAIAEATRRSLWSEHLAIPVDETAGDPCALVDEVWRPLAREQQARLHAGDRLTRPLVELPAVSRRTKRLLGPLQGLLVDG